MQPLPVPSPRLPAAWSDVLAKVQEALNQAVAATAEREQRLAEVGPLSPANGVNWEEALLSFGDRLRTLETFVRRSEQSVTDADTSLAAGEEELRTWLAATAAARGQLAEWVARAVG